MGLGSIDARRCVGQDVGRGCCDGVLSMLSRMNEYEKNGKVLTMGTGVQTERWKMLLFVPTSFFGGIGPNIAGAILGNPCNHRLKTKYNIGLARGV